MRPSGGTGQRTKAPRQKRGPLKSHRTATAAARDRGPSVAELQDELNTLRRAEQERARELTESLQQQSATADILKVISRATFDLPTVLDALLRSAGSLCEADMGAVVRPQDERFIFAASFGLPQAHVDLVKDMPFSASRGTLAGRMMIERRPVHIPDVLADPEFSLSEAQKAAGYRSMLGVPLLRDGIFMGIILLMRSHVRPFTDKQIDLAQTFADQAVIAIENVRLFEAEQERTRELTESLQQQTATSEILTVISSSLADTQPVFEAIVQTGAKLFPNATITVALCDRDQVKAAAIILKRCGVVLSLPMETGASSPCSQVPHAK